MTAFSDLQKITSSSLPRDQRLVAMRGFARQLDWTPSYEFEASFGLAAAEDHLVVEHGLDTTAVITFLRAPYNAADLTASEMRGLLSISYNNLVDWHLFVSQTDIRQVNNLARPSGNAAGDRLFPLSSDAVDVRLSASELQRLRLVRDYPKSHKSCDDALIDVLTRWKRLLKADYPTVSNSSLSTLFNAIIFVRGCEDRHFDRPNRVDRPLLATLSEVTGGTVDLPSILEEALRRADVSHSLREYADVTAISTFKSMDRATAENLIREFYVPRDAHYDFNFALMSKHALSRIYERYVALFDERADQQDQLNMFGSVPELEGPRKGSIYTPQFIAGFFSRYVKDNTTPKTFRSMRYIDPACGSGIFLRTMLEHQSNPLQEGVNRDTITSAFANAEGIDRDPNAVAATNLSLSLLHLVATGFLPTTLPITVSDAIQDALDGRLVQGTYDAVFSNPPYIKLDHLQPSERSAYAQYMGAEFRGRIDSYLAFIKLAAAITKPNGFICLVLPQVFLISQNASLLRAQISEQFDVRCLVDLSQVDVFEVGAYSILLILQRRQGAVHIGGDAIVAQITDFVGPALQACLEGRSVSNAYHKVFALPQAFFRRPDWSLIDPKHLAVEERVRGLPTISSYLNVSQGFVSGADPIFIRKTTDIPAAERKIYMDYLPDRDIRRFVLPDRADQVFFYPYINNSLLTDQALEKQFPKTWEYLSKNRTALEARGPVRRGSTPWWRPERPRTPTIMRRPKIVAPHLSLTPRFALDTQGRFAVSHTPFLTAKEDTDEQVLLRFFVGILNSSLVGWYISVFAPKFAHGYSRIEANLIKNVPVPDISRIGFKSVTRISDLVSQLEATPKNYDEIAGVIDEEVLRLYGLSDDERMIVTGRVVGE